MQNFIYYPKRIYQLGLYNTIKQVNHRITKKTYALRLKKKALRFSAGYKIQKNFKEIFNTLQSKNFLETMLHNPEFAQHIPTQKDLFSIADQTAQNNFELLGKKLHFQKEIDWLQNYPLHFYQDIKPVIGNDIKIPWELSRFYQNFYLGYAYKKSKESKYKDAFVAQTTSWIKHNPFLLGPNWVCPMEAAIRAINFIWGFYFFKDASNITKNFWKPFIEALYNHAHYLEHNWEISDKPNNHYLADLLGYFYLCTFFDPTSRLRQGFGAQRKWVYKKLLEQFDHQVFDDGTSYEGSTCYHRLVTEMCLHFRLLCKVNNFVLSKKFEEKYTRMCDFLQACSYDGKHIVQIGDNDSGKVVLGVNMNPSIQFCRSKITRDERVQEKSISSPLVPSDFFVKKIVSRDKNLTNHYPNFGLTVIKNGSSQKLRPTSWHITFRHPTYKKHQPSGHFHQDELSITLAINGIPILVDPGTFTYTQDPKARNLFRSKEMHNTFYTNQKKEFTDLFQLQKTEQNDQTEIIETQEKIKIKSFQRTIILHKQENMLEVLDTPALPCMWNLIFHPNITIEKNKNCFIVRHNGSKLITITSTLDFKIKKTTYSPEYGKILECAKIFAKKQYLNTAKAEQRSNVCQQAFFPSPQIFFRLFKN